MGIVENGSEQLVAIENPWNAVGWFEVRTAFELFNRAQYSNAAKVLSELLQKVQAHEVRVIVEFLRDIMQAVADWDAFQHARALKAMERAVRELPKVQGLIEAEFPELHLLLEWLETARDHLRALKIAKDGALPLSEPLCEELLSNALRRARLEGKYEDATARLYSLFEKEVKRRLLEQHNLDNSACLLDSIPETIRDDYSRYADEKNVCRFGLKGTVHLLQALGSQDLFVERYLEKEKEIDRAIGARNASILGHGTQPITEAKFDELLILVLFVLGVKEDEVLCIPKIQKS
ncbi:TIGR02710 family CRISPR-associated protein [Verrucomicrobia bacterium S94]|nr:TIGR02710 family CRISPR-associated protein [Verrucomicrobia bacterium S94]